MIFGHFIDFGHFPIEIPIEVEKKVPKWEGKVVQQKQKLHAKLGILNFVKEEYSI